jgi:hypothetical protein
MKRDGGGASSIDEISLFSMQDIMDFSRATDVRNQ